MTETWILDAHAPDPGLIARAAALLATGDIVALPTDTVYGLAADLARPDAVARIFEVKERPAEKGLILFVEGPDEWCNDETIATDLGYRWDGVHVYKPGANLIYTTVAPDILRLAAV